MTLRIRMLTAAGLTLFLTLAAIAMPQAKPAGKWIELFNIGLQNQDVTSHVSFRSVKVREIK